MLYMTDLTIRSSALLLKRYSSIPKKRHRASVHRPSHAIHTLITIKHKTPRNPPNTKPHHHHQHPLPSQSPSRRSHQLTLQLIPNLLPDHRPSPLPLPRRLRFREGFVPRAVVEGEVPVRYGGAYSHGGALGCQGCGGEAGEEAGEEEGGFEGCCGHCLLDGWLVQVGWLVAFDC